MKRKYSFVTLRACLRKLLTVLTLLFVCGCGVTLRAGRMPDIASLDELKINASTKAEVLQLLGKPRNGGRIMFPIQNSPQDVWCYYYEESTLSDSQRIFLFVFFDQEHYTGYMWVSSLPQLTNPAKKPPSER